MRRYQIEYTLSDGPTRTKLKKHIEEEIADKIHENKRSHYIIDCNLSIVDLTDDLKGIVKGNFDYNGKSNRLIVAPIRRYYTLKGKSNDLEWKGYYKSSKDS